MTTERIVERPVPAPFVPDERVRRTQTDDPVSDFLQRSRARLLAYGVRLTLKRSPMQPFVKDAGPKSS